ncbi:unnamed protein product [Spirodela intermedia]|uniref:RRM domain-containing protein n=2 Tax=Spirodela intermedia TaxID=51605 RepID=A0A7I8KXT1_SPIIN|nr:unnamed protein product [Spirodela intermedia]CAA6665095.1 unnamed protein product [Spirodela intermedia]CAA7401754.1 unnamed protein product [Spirodela intermedia]
MAKTPEQRARRSAAKKKRKLLRAANYGSRASAPPAAEMEKKEAAEVKQMRRRDSKDLILFGTNASSYSDSDAGGEEIPDVQRLLEPYTKEKLVEFLCDAAIADSGIYSRIREVAERDVSHRKVFIHGLPWDVTKETLSKAFSSFGAVEECNVVADKATGRCKGYGFVLFQSRSGAIRALEQSNKQIGGRMAHCQLASVGPATSSAGSSGHQAGTAGRKIYVSNVHAEANADKLKGFFAKFGEIEAGPMGYDVVTGRSRGYAIFVYRSQEGARRALEEPYKMFEGHRLHCQWAAEPAKVKDLFSTAAGGATVAPSAAGLVGAAPQPVLAAVVAAQNLSLYNPTAPAYAALLGQNSLLAAAIGMNPAAVSAALNPLAAGPALFGGLPGYGGSSSLLGAYRTQMTAGLHELEFARSSLGRPGSSYDGMGSYSW